MDKRIRTHREILALCPPGDPKRARSLVKLSKDLWTRFKQSGQIKDLEDVISCHREVLTLRPPGHPGRSISLEKLAETLQTRFEKLGRNEDLKDVISLHREALSLTPPGHTNRSFSLDNLAGSLQTQFEKLGQIKDLEDAISFHREALSLRPPSHPDRSFSLYKLAETLQTRFEKLSQINDLEDVISLHREALTLTPPGHPDRSNALTNLGNDLEAQFRQVDEIENLEDAISFYREALTLTPPGHLDRSISLNNLAESLQKRFEKLGQIKDREDAMSLNREALTLRPPGHPDRSSSLNNLAVNLIDRFWQLGQIEDLEDAISFHRKALTLCPPGNQGRSSSLNNLAIALGSRFEQLGRIEDLEDMISFHRESLVLTPPGDHTRNIPLIGLANALEMRFYQSDQIKDLEDAITFYREALTLTPPGHQQRTSSLDTLAEALQTLFEQSGQIEDLEEAISFYQEALTLCPPGHPLRSETLIGLADGLQSRFEQLDRIEDLEDAISFDREAVMLNPAGHSHRSWSLNTLAGALEARFDKLGQNEDLNELFALYEQAANDLSSKSWDRLRAALDWADASRRYQHKSIIIAYSVSLSLLDRCFISRPTIQLQHKFLAGNTVPKSLASDAASSAIDLGELAVAVEFLERGRAILWSKIEGYRSPLDELRQVNSELANHLESLGTQLEYLALSSKSGSLDTTDSHGLSSSDAQIRDHRILSEGWEKVVEKVRQVEGFGNFLQAVPFTALQTAAAEGPVILINISEYRSDAIILCAESPPTLVTLPDLHPEDLTRLTEQLVFACNAGPDAKPSKYFTPILRDMWDNIVSPVVNCLIELGVQEKSRVWWCPTSELCALPLHAAGPYRPYQKNLSDIYISSYIPTLSSLIRARFDAVSQAVVPKLVVIGQPGEDLPNIQEEIGTIQRLGDSVNVIIGAQANRENVLSVLQQHSWTHFACHGHLGEQDKPFLASFQLHGGKRLTLLDLMQARLPNAELAFLSACHSAAGDLITPDETIHLAAALQFCGFRSVVGTLWEMDDKDGPGISQEFYNHMFRKPGKQANFRDSAEALSLAIRNMRKNGVPLHRWIMFVHIGA